MLPDFPALKAEIQRIILAKLRLRIDTGDPVLSQIKGFTQHEGREMRYEQHGGGTVQEGFEEIGTGFEIPIADVPFLIGEKLNAKLEEIAQDIIAQSAKRFFKKVGESSEKAGTSMDAGGKPVSAELLLDMTEKMQTAFTSDGSPLGSWIVHPDMLPAMKKASEEIENDPELKRRQADILERQREAWIARESNRKLVD